jgi:hypothetical protein
MLKSGMIRRCTTRPCRLAVLVLLGLGIASLTAAEVYKVVDENGRVTYTDAPAKGQTAEKLELKETNSVPRTRVTTRLSPAEEKQTIPTDYQVQITYPPNDYHVNPGQRDLSVQVAVDPPLHPNHSLQITDNGESVDGTTLENIVVRGAHRLQAKVVDEQGRVVSESAPVRFYVHRPAVGR